MAVLDSEQVDDATRSQLLDLWRRAFEGRFTAEDAEHAYGGVHVVVRLGDRVVGHASAVPRRIRFGDDEWRTIGYVEAVATDPDHQGRGIGRRVMVALQEQIARRWPVAMLSTGRARGFYALLGWERWEGR